MWRLSIIRITIALGCCTEFVWAQSNLDVNPFPMPSGAPVAEVNGLAEDTDGGIWVVTWGEGAHRIDGTEWKTYTEDDGLPDDWARAVCPSADGGVWVGTGEGIARIKDGAVQTVTKKDLPLLSNPDIFFVGERDNGELWVSTRGGWILSRTPVAESPNDLLLGWRVLAGPEVTEGQTIDQMVEVSSHEILFSLQGGPLLWYRDGAFVTDTTTEDGAGHSLLPSTADGHRTVLAATQDGSAAHRWAGDHWIPAENGPVGLRGLVVDAHGDRYAATVYGFYQHTEQGWEPYPLPAALGEPFLQEILVARDGAVWLGGKEGLYRATTRTWTSASTEAVGLLARANEEEPILAMDDSGGVYGFEGGVWKSQFQLVPWTGQHWRCDESIWMGDGRVWRGPGGAYQGFMVSGDEIYRVADQHLRVYAAADGQLLREELMPTTIGESGRYFLTRDKDIWWIAERAVYRRDGDTWVPWPDVEGYQPRHTTAIRETEKGTFWVGLNNGIERWENGVVNYFGSNAGINEGDSVHAICPARDGTIWFGSVGSGVYRYDAGTFQQLTTADGLYRNSVKEIFEASDGTIWFAYRGTGVTAFRNGRWAHFTIEHGLPNATVFGFAEPEPGVLWIFAADGRLYRYTPDTEPPETRIDVGPNAVDASGVGVFSFTGRDAWNQTQPRDLQYSWRIIPQNGANAETQRWSPFSSANTVASGTLDAGDYHFEVRSSDASGNVDVSPASLSFSVAPPLWRTPVFYVPVALSLVLASVAMAFRRRSHVALLHSESALRGEVEAHRKTEALLAEHRDSLEALVEERSRELKRAHEELIRKERLATLGQLTATVSHELRNPLGTIQSSLFLIEKRVRDQGLNLEGALERSARSIRRCDQIIEEMLDYTRSQDVERIDVAFDAWLEKSIADLDVPGDVAVTLDLNCATAVPMDPELMRRVLVNLFDNAFQAMEENGDDAKGIRVVSTRQQGHATLLVEDTGPGISEDVLNHIFEPLFSTKNFGVGLGTNIVKNILERHKGSVEYSNAPGSGARVTLRLPLGTVDDGDSSAATPYRDM